MELLERDWAVAALTSSWDAAAGGTGRVVLVTGEPGIGKTWLVRQFLHDLGPRAKVLLGTCDDLSIPRPLGPIRDLAGNVSGELAAALAAGAAPHDIQTLLLAELELPPSPTVLVLEDVHWADDATLDSITLLGRRISTLPALLVLTFRGGEVPPGHRLHTAIGTIRAEDTDVVELAPLSMAAVQALAGDNAGMVFAVTGGNPFYVSELLASRTAAQLPPSVANAVLGRVSRLGAESRRLVELISVVPGRVKTTLLDAVMPHWASSAEEPERRQLLEVEGSYVRFRHELTRNAVRSSIPIAARRRLHAEFLNTLLSAGADPADIVHHAEAAGAEDVIAEFALRAARRAAALESHREAYAHYRRAVSFVERLAPAEAAAVLHEFGNAAYLVNRIDESFEPVERAAAIYEELSDLTSVGRCMRFLSRLHWFAGDGAEARASALEAISILEPLGESIELAQAYSAIAQLEMLALQIEEGLRWSRQAIDLAVRLDDDATRAHALVNLASTQLHLDPEAATELLKAHEFANSVGEWYEATRALNNLGYSLMCWARPAAALAYTRQALAFSEEHEVHNLSTYATTMTAWHLLRGGEWDDAERIATAQLDNDVSVLQLLAKTVLTELAVRRGDADASERLADLAAQADRSCELQRLAPVIELSTEYALTRDLPMPTGLYDKLIREFHPRGVVTGWGGVRMQAWSNIAGIDIGFDADPSSLPPCPFVAMVNSEWLAAADAFGEIGWTYDRALMLSLLDDEPSLAEALDIARRLRAEPLATRVMRRMRDLSIRVPRGEREVTRFNPAGLTARQLEVLSLVAGGMTNAEIAAKLVVSQRTAEHHVAAVLTKLGVTTRRQAARRAGELGLADKA